MPDRLSVEVGEAYACTATALKLGRWWPCFCLSRPKTLAPALLRVEGGEVYTWTGQVVSCGSSVRGLNCQHVHERSHVQHFRYLTYT